MLAGCNKHPTVRAEYRCVQCGKPMCEKCVVNTRFCSEACNGKYSKFAAHYKKPDEIRQSGILPTIFFFMVVGGAAWVTKYVLHLW